MLLPPPRVPLVYPVQAVPGGYRIGEGVFSLISYHSDELHGSIDLGAKGTVIGPDTSGSDPDETLMAEFEGYGTYAVGLTQISRGDPNNVGDDYCTARPP